MTTEQINTIREALERIQRAGEYIKSYRTPSLGPKPEVITTSAAEALAALRSLPTPESAEPVAWKWQQLIHGYMGGWHSKCEGFNPLENIHTKPEDIRGLTPLYTHPPKPDRPRVVLTDEKGHLPAGVDPITDAAHFVVNSFDHLTPYKEDEDGDMVESVVYKERVEEIEGILAHVLPYLRDNGYLAPATFPAKEVKEVVGLWMGVDGKSFFGDDTKELEADLEARLTAKFSKP